MKARNVWIALPLAVLVLAVILLGRGRTHEAPAMAVMQGDKQIIEVLAKSGYHPGEVIARAGVPIELKLKTDGTLDGTFGGGDGIVTTPIGSSNDVATSVALQSDGKIVIAGYTTSSTDNASRRALEPWSNGCSRRRQRQVGRSAS